MLHRNLGPGCHALHRPLDGGGGGGGPVRGRGRGGGVVKGRDTVVMERYGGVDHQGHHPLHHFLHQGVEYPRDVVGRVGRRNGTLRAHNVKGLAVW